MQKKVILLTVTNDLVFDQRMHKICSSLQQYGYEVLLIGRKRKKSILLSQKNFRHYRIKCFWEKGKLFYIEYNIRLFFYLLFTPAHIISAVDLDTLLPCFLISKLKNIPLVYDAHEYFPDLPEVLNRPKTRKAWLLVEAYIVPKLRHCYTVSTGIAKHFEKLYGKPFKVIRNVPYLSPNSEAKVNENKYLIYQGMLNKGRGLKELIQAMQYVKCKLILLGTGDIQNELKQLVEQLQLSEKIIFKGFVPPGQLINITPVAYLGINPSESQGKSYYFSLNNKFFDYIHAGIPQVAMNLPEYKTLNDQFNVAVLIDNLQPQFISEAINKLLNDERLYNLLKENTLKAQLKLNWQCEEDELLKIYNQIL